MKTNNLQCKLNNRTKQTVGILNVLFYNQISGYFLENLVRNVRKYKICRFRRYAIVTFSVHTQLDLFWTLLMFANLREIFSLFLQIQAIRLSKESRLMLTTASTNWYSGQSLTQARS